MLRLLWFFLLYSSSSALFCAHLNAQGLLVHLSTDELKAEHVPTQIEMLNYIRHSYLGREPHGKTILIVNGSGAVNAIRGRVSSDFFLRVLRFLSGDWEIILNVGFIDPEQEGLSEFIRVLDLNAKEARLEGKTPVVVTNANIVPRADLADLFEDFRDVVMASGTRLRFAGFVSSPKLSEALSPAEKSPLASTLAIASVPLELSRQIGKSENDRVRVFFPIVYGEIDGLRGHLIPENASKIEHRNPVRTPLAFATGPELDLDDDIFASAALATTGVEVGIVELDSDGKPTQKQHLFLSMQAEHPPLVSHGSRSSSNTVRALNYARTELQIAQLHETRVIARTGGFSATSHVLSHRREPLGNAIADAMASWARVYLSQSLRQSLDEVPRAVAFLDSFAYLRDKRIPRGDFTNDDLQQMFPNPNEGIGVYFATGRQIRNLYLELRHYHARRNHSYSPQMNSDLVLTEPNTLEFDDRNNGRQPLLPDETYILAVDPGLSQNKYSLPTWGRFLGSKSGNNHHVRPRIDLATALEASLRECQAFVEGEGPRRYGRVPRRRQSQ